MNTFKHYFLRYLPYLPSICFFLISFLVWGLGRALGFASLNSLLSGIGIFLLLSIGYVLLYRGAVRRAALERALRPIQDPSAPDGGDGVNAQMDELRQRLLHYAEGRPSIPGRGANNVLPWYLVMGDSSAGKSTLLAQAGLNFPYAECNGEQAGGTRNCNVLLSTEAVWLDTAGRFMNDPQAASAWRGMLDLLRGHRPRQPLNGVIVTVSIHSLLHDNAEAQARSARLLRERLQQAQKLLEARLPLYLVFTQCDSIPGFTSFYQGKRTAGHKEALGKTFSHAGYQHTDWCVRFSQAMDELIEHLRHTAARRVALQDVQVTRRDPAPYRFPLELAALKPRLEAFINALLRANPYQPPELLRGFYFTSALETEQQVETGVHSQQVVQRFSLISDLQSVNATGHPGPLFVEGLFRDVIIADRHLAGWYACNYSEQKRKVAWAAGTMIAAMMLCSLWGWAWWSNTQNLEVISGEIAQAVTDDNATEAQYTSWHRLDRLRAWAAHYYVLHRNAGVPLASRMGLYQGYKVEALIRSGYFAQLKQVMLQPTADNLTRSLTLLPTIKVYQRRAKSAGPITGLDSVEPTALPSDNRAQSVAEFGKAMLTTYVMLTPAQREQAEPAFLKKRIPEYWYPAIAKRSSAITRNDYEFASRQIDFYSEQIREPDVPRIIGNAFLISSARNYIDSLLSQSLRALETITLESDTLFAFARSDFQSLKAEGQNQLSAIASKLLNTPNLGKVIISGHADQLGDPHTNLQVSMQRAETIKTYLAGKGVPIERMVAIGKGSGKPLVYCEPQQSRTQLIQCLEPNRRVEIEVRALDVPSGMNTTPT
ncbi:type VI secretion protein IcmF/TssM N-terminal domain-containing protein [Pseudomonas japonica]|uniref:type VI secretion protein IcmF/TssM N-terminal domain-containing protein n=1 Tax=Pseudomonas japonica TaxID=256466 RepID=UPI0015E41289|nr:type VI secretion protein IcmF/TssM N-terminal domain-containing protein [Pseudomonas japonica]MBA1245061.1 OmpA family protein [Pseudomonas japonica]